MHRVWHDSASIYMKWLNCTLNKQLVQLYKLKPCTHSQLFYPHQWHTKVWWILPLDNQLHLFHTLANLFKFQLYWFKKLWRHILSSLFPKFHTFSYCSNSKFHHNWISVTVYDLRKQPKHCNNTRTISAEIQDINCKFFRTGEITYYVQAYTSKGRGNQPQGWEIPVVPTLLINPYELKIIQSYSR